MLRLPCFALLCALVLSLLMPASATAQEKFDVVIYGGTPAGIAAAVAAGRDGRAVLLAEPYSFIGGLVTNGLSHTDFRTFEGLSVAFLEFARRVEKHYVDEYGADSPQVQRCFRGTMGEPHVNQMIFEQMLAELPSVKVLTKTTLQRAAVAGEGAARRITAVTLHGPDGEAREIAGTVYIDASYEGDLMAAAGVEHRIGREARGEYGESLAPETADGQVQGYNFRFMMTQVPENRVLPEAPAGYNRDEFIPLIGMLKEGRFPEGVFCDSTGGIYKAHLPPLPHGKHDINDVSRGLARLSLPDINDPWPAGDAATRRRIYDEHVRHNVGMLYFLQNDEAVPEEFRKEAREWGFCRDEFAEHGHIPEQLYVREARRMTGRHVFTENDTDAAPNDVRAKLHRDSIAIGDYSHNCHGTSHEGPRFGGKHEGEFYKGAAPYQVPYGVLLPKDCENLLVPVACSSSHVGFCALRLEPIWMSLGQAAGTAASLAIEQKTPPHEVPAGAVQGKLHHSGGATIYVSDVAPGSDDFAAVQWWGTLGGLHGLAPAFEKAGQRGERIISQYYEAYPGHEARLDAELDAATRERWMKLAGEAGIDPELLKKAATRGEFIRAAFSVKQ